MLVAILLLLAFCSDWNKPQYYELSESESQELMVKRQEAYQYAINCSGITSPKIPYDKLTWVLVPGSRLHITAIDGSIWLKGYFSPKDSVIYIPFTERHTEWIMAHEALHAIGVIGHPRIPFETCELMADQNP